MNEELSNDLTSFVKRKWGYNCENLKRSTSIEKDLGVTGDDADDFMSAFIDEFRIKDYSKYKSAKYFGSEPFDFITPIIQLITGGKRTRETLTLGDLEDAIKNNKLA